MAPRVGPMSAYLIVDIDVEIMDISFEVLLEVQVQVSALVESTVAGDVITTDRDLDGL